MKYERDSKCKFSMVGLKTEEATKQGMQAASRSWEWSLVDGQQKKVGTSILSPQGTANNLNELKSRFFPQSLHMKWYLEGTLISVFEALSREVHARTIL